VRKASGQGGNGDGPWTYTVGPGGHLSDVWMFPDGSAYDLSVYGPNGFLRAFRGSLSGRNKANLTVRSRYGERGGITLDVQNHGASHAKVRILDAYTNHSSVHEVRSGDSFIHHASLDGSYEWYDLVIEVESDATFLQRVAGHVETGEDSASDPRLGK
jgi:phospholipase C